MHISCTLNLYAARLSERMILVMRTGFFIWEGNNNGALTFDSDY